MTEDKKSQKKATTRSSMKTCAVELVYGDTIEIDIPKAAVGQVLFDKVCDHIDLLCGHSNLLERDYFGLTYQDDKVAAHIKFWLNVDKKISKQKKNGAWVFEFAVKFYPSVPTQLQEHLTRYLVGIQIRRDIFNGRLPCSLLLGSYSVQAAKGDYDPNEHGDGFDYIKDMPFAPNQTPELLEKIAELHRQHKGQTPEEADLHLLENAKELDMYGVELHKATYEGIDIMLGVCASGLFEYNGELLINRFVWPKILKISYKRNNLYINIRPSEFEMLGCTIGFKLETRRLAKRLWETCVEHYAFFILREPKQSENGGYSPDGTRFFILREPKQPENGGYSPDGTRLDSAEMRLGPGGDRNSSLDIRDTTRGEGDAPLDREGYPEDSSLAVQSGNLTSPSSKRTTEEEKKFKEAEKERKKTENEEEMRRKKKKTLYIRT